MSVHQLSLPQLQTLVNNQEECSDLPPVTMRATFKVSKILELIAEVVRNPEFKPDDDYTHNICITFVRQEFEENPFILGYSEFEDLRKNGQEKNGRTLSQVIPIITGCVARVDEKKQNVFFRYMRRIDNTVPFVRSGGEGSGLIPPPPPNDETFR